MDPQLTDLSVQLYQVRCGLYYGALAVFIGMAFLTLAIYRLAVALEKVVAGHGPGPGEE